MGVSRTGQFRLPNGGGSSLPPPPNYLEVIGMDEKRSYLVLGPESSGTRMMTEILIAAGCDGDAGHEQRWDTESPTSDRIVWRRSAPHGGGWPNIDGMVWELRRLGYSVFAIVLNRDWTAMAKSQGESWGHTFESAIRNIRSAYPHIFSDLRIKNVPYICVSYESLIQRGPQVLSPLFEILGGLDVPEFTVYDGNSKWLDRQEVVV